MILRYSRVTVAEQTAILVAKFVQTIEHDPKKVGA